MYPASSRVPGPGSRVPIQGFTLIEVLVALVILATVVGVAVLSLSGFDARRAEREAERMTALLRLACEQAELAGREIGLHLGAEGYGFSLATVDGWLGYGAGHRFRPRELDGVSLALAGGELPDAPDFDVDPQALCWPSGELSALDVRMIHNDRALARVRTGADALPWAELSDGGRTWRSARPDSRNDR